MLTTITLIFSILFFSILISMKKCQLHTNKHVLSSSLNQQVIYLYINSTNHDECEIKTRRRQQSVWYNKLR